jgi:hypothetical protein
LGNAPTDSGETVTLLKACAGGDGGACGQLESINAADLKAAEKAIAKIDPHLLTQRPEIGWDGTIEYWKARSGSTEFWSGDIALSRGYGSRAELVETVAHELQHSRLGILGRAVSNALDVYFPVRQNPYGLGAIHNSIWERGEQVRLRYEKMIGGLR